MNDNIEFNSPKSAAVIADELESKLKKDRVYWMSLIEKLITSLNNVNTLSSAQVSMLSYRQILNDKIVEIQYIVYKKETAYDKLFKNKYLEYLTSTIKANGGERDKLTKCDLTDSKRHINILETHIAFYKECIKTLDNMAYAIRNKIKLEEDF